MSDAPSLELFSVPAPPMNKTDAPLHTRHHNCLQIEIKGRSRINGGSIILKLHRRTSSPRTKYIALHHLNDANPRDRPTSAGKRRTLDHPCGRGINRAVQTQMSVPGLCHFTFVAAERKEKANHLDPFFAVFLLSTNRTRCFTNRQN